LALGCRVRRRRILSLRSGLRWRRPVWVHGGRSAGGTWRRRHRAHRGLARLLRLHRWSRCVPVGRWRTRRRGVVRRGSSGDHLRHMRRWRASRRRRRRILVGRARGRPRRRCLERLGSTGQRGLDSGRRRTLGGWRRRARALSVGAGRRRTGWALLPGERRGDGSRAGRRSARYGLGHHRNVVPNIHLLGLRRGRLGRR